MKNYADYAIDELKKAGLKLTKPRQQIVDFLAQSDTVLSPYEMREQLKQNKVNADVVTIYRVLDTLESLGLVHKVLALNGYVRCSTPSTKKSETCHHYLVCSQCHRVEEVEGEDLSALEKRILANQKFAIKSHYLEFMGICHRCQEKG
jgi:Fur family transcriptional regulator, ferric uptake regulator